MTAKKKYHPLQKEPYAPPTAEPDVQHKAGKAESVPPITHDLPPTPRERRDARRKAALAEADKSWADRRARERPKGGSVNGR